MITFEEAFTRTLGAAWQLPVEQTTIADALGRVLAADVHSDVSMPPFNRSSMDGYACRAEDAFQPLRVLEHIPAGYVPNLPILPGTCSKIMTGAPMPEGADCVLIVEEVEEAGDGRVRFRGTQPRGNFVARGHEVREGDCVLKAGTILRAAHLPVLASAGCIEPRVFRQPRVAVMATGDELVAPEISPGAGQIRNSNSIQLVALAQEAGAVAKDYGIVRDESSALQAAWARALEENDVVFSTGGVSMGDYDLVPDILAHHGFRVHFDRVAIQPGKPVLFGTRGDRACFGLSGNPVSSFLQFMLFAAPFLWRLQGATPAVATVPLVLSERFTRRNAGRMGWVPISLDDAGGVCAVEFHGSAHINAFTNARGIMAFPVGVDTLEAGETVPVRLL